MRNLVRVVLLAALISTAAAGCGSSSGGSDANTTGARTQAIQKLERSGLTKAQATCMADKLGPQTVVSVSDMSALAAGQPYQDAAKTCIHAP